MRASTRWRPQAQLVLLLMLLLLLLLPAGCGGSSVMPQPAVNFASTSHHGIVEGGKGFLLPMSSSLGIHAAIQAVKAQPSARQASPRRDRLQDSDFVPKSIDSESDVAIAASSVYNEELLEEDSDEGWESMLDRMLVERDAANVGRVHPILPLGTDPKMCSAEVERCVPFHPGGPDAVFQPLVL